MNNMATETKYKFGNGSIEVEKSTQVTTTITVDNFKQRMERLRHLGDDEFQRTTEITTFLSKVLPLLSSRSDADGDVVYFDYHVRAVVELNRKGNIDIWVQNVGHEAISPSLLVQFKVPGHTDLAYDWTEIKLESKKYFGFTNVLPRNKNKCIDSGGNVTITFIMEVCTTSTSYEDADKIPRGPPETVAQMAASDLRKDMLKLGADSADIVLICEEKEFPVHKVIVAARSDVFSAMFQHEGTREAKTNQVKIDDTDAKTVKRFLHYVYGGSVSGISFEDADSLMIMADKYNVQGLKAACRSVLLDKLTPANSINCAIIGYHCNDDVLKKAAMKKIVSSGKSIKEIEDYEELKKYPELSIEMLEHYSSNLSLK